MFGTLKPHIFPLQKPHPPIGVAGLSKNSDTLQLAGERGFWPMKPQPEPGLRGSHWDAVEEGAARGKRTAKRSDCAWSARSFVADTDAEAIAPLRGRHDGPHDDRVLPAPARRVRLHRVPQARSPSVPDSDVTPEYCAKHNWLIGSPATVADKLNAL